MTLRDLPEYDVWAQAKDRCINPKNHSYARYGGRGIKMCPEWAGSFKAFLRDMGPRPKSGKMTLERKDVNGDYCKENCKWETYGKQNRNYSRNVYVWRGEQKFVLKDLSLACCLKPNTVVYRRRLGWDQKDWFKPYSVEEAIDRFLLESSEAAAA